MGEPCRPTDEESASLLTRLPELHRQAADAISSADVLIVITGAGWSVPSGLKTYADVADDYGDGTTYQTLCNPALLHANGDTNPAPGGSEAGAAGTVTDPSDTGSSAASSLSPPPSDSSAAEEAPRKRQRLGDLPSGQQLFHGFWGGCYNAYTSASPHVGYDHVLRWRENLADPSSGFFCLTSNVDGHWYRKLPVGEQLEEFNGSCMHWRCASKACAEVRKRKSFAPFDAKKDCFTETGTGRDTHREN